MKPDVSCILNLHTEGQLADRSITSLFECIAFAQNFGLTIESIAVLDQACEQTASTAKSYSFDKVIEVNHADLGLARNSGVQAALGKYVCFFDGDDLYSNNWIYKAFIYAEKLGGFVSVHPQCILTFGQRSNLTFCPNGRYACNWEPGQLLFNNLWPSSQFTLNAIMKKIPYQSSSKTHAWGYEDWHWNTLTLAEGIRHVTAKKTILFYRIKPHIDSLSSSQSIDNTIIKYSPFFEYKCFRKTTGSKLIFSIRQTILNTKRCIFQILEGLRKRWTIYTDIILPQHAWIAAHVNTTNKLEPAISISSLKQTLHQRINKPKLHLRATRCFIKLIRNTPEKLDYLFLLGSPADLQLKIQVSNLIQQLQNDGKACLLVRVDETASKQPVWRPSTLNMRYIPEMRLLDQYERECLLIKLITQKTPSVIKICNSVLGKTVCEKHGKSIYPFASIEII